MAKVKVIVAAGVVGVVSIGNAIGRVFWAWISDIITRRFTFVVMFLLQAVLFWVLPATSSPALLTELSFTILMCYGGFGTMPAFTADYFGSKNVSPIYGLMLTAWGAASAFVPLLVSNMRQTTGNYLSGFHVLSAVVVASTLLPLIIRPPARSGDSDTSEVQPESGAIFGEKGLGRPCWSRLEAFD